MRGALQVLGQDIDADHFQELWGKVHSELDEGTTAGAAPSDQAAVQLHRQMVQVAEAVASVAGWSQAVNAWQRETIAANNELLRRNMEQLQQLRLGGFQAGGISTGAVPHDISQQCDLLQQELSARLSKPY